jgi:hypothetical protein
MSRNLLNYKDWVPLESLSGVYFNKVFANEPSLVRQPLVIKVENGNASIISPNIMFKKEGTFHIVRIILELHHGGKVTSRHSNVLIVDTLLNKIVRFEPLAGVNTNNIDQLLISTLKPSFKGYDYLPVSVHPQDSLKDMGLCVAYTIKFTLFYINRLPIVFEGAYDIHSFALAVKDLHPATAQEQASDVEFGGLGGGLALGLLGGLAIGGLAYGLASPRTTTYVYT